MSSEEATRTSEEIARRTWSSRPRRKVVVLAGSTGLSLAALAVGLAAIVPAWIAASRLAYWPIVYRSDWSV